MKSHNSFSTQFEKRDPPLTPMRIPTKSLAFAVLFAADGARLIQASTFIHEFYRDNAEFCSKYKEHCTLRRVEVIKCLLYGFGCYTTVEEILVATFSDLIGRYKEQERKASLFENQAVSFEKQAKKYLNQSDFFERKALKCLVDANGYEQAARSCLDKLVEFQEYFNDIEERLKNRETSIPLESSSATPLESSSAIPLESSSATPLESSSAESSSAISLSAIPEPLFLFVGFICMGIALCFAMANFTKVPSVAGHNFVGNGNFQGNGGEGNILAPGDANNAGGSENAAGQENHLVQMRNMGNVSCNTFLSSNLIESKYSESMREMDFWPPMGCLYPKVPSPGVKPERLTKKAR